MSFLQKIIEKKRKDKFIVSLDIGTKIAKAMVSHIDYDSGTVTNLGIGKAEQKPENIVGGKIFNVEGVISSCREAIEEAEKMANVRPKEMIMGFSGNTVKVSTHSSEIVRENPQSKMEMSELKNIIRDAYSRSSEKIEHNLTYREREAGIKLVSADVVDLNIDGYRVVNPLNFKGGKIKICISSSYILNSDFDVIGHMAEKLGLKPLKVAYGPYSVIKALGMADIHNFSAVLIDVGGNITDVVLVKNGNIRRAGMFILGGQLFTKRISNKFGISEKDAEELKIKYSKGRFDDNEKARMEEILAEDIDLWLSGVQLVLEESNEKSLVPSNVLFYGGGSQLPNLAASLNKLAKTTIPFSGRISLDFVRLNHIAGNIDKTGKLDSFQDITLVGLAHLCLDSADKEDTANNLLESIILKK
jgi:cell division protein FtsA